MMTLLSSRSWPARSTLLALLVSMSACAVDKVTMLVGSDGGVVGDDDDADDDVVVDDRDGGRRDGASKTDASNDDADASVESQYASDSANCGAKGHSCLGATCSAGLCKPEVVRSSLVRWFDVDKQGSLVTVFESSGVPDQVRVGARQPNATDNVVFSGELDVQTLGAFSGSSLFYSEYVGKNQLVRWSGSGGAAGTKQVLDAAGTANYSFAVDDASVFFASGGALYSMTHAGASKTRLGGTQLYAYTSGVALDDTDVFVVGKSAPPTSKSKDVLVRIPKIGGTAAELTELSMYDSYSVDDVTATHVVGNGMVDAGKLATCELLESFIWSSPKVTGTAKILFTSTSGRISMVKAWGDYVYWTVNGCATTDNSKIYRRRIDGSDKAVVLVDSTSRFGVIDVDDTYVYWNYFSLYRVAK